jgi:hypothetical protein
MRIHQYLIDTIWQQHVDPILKQGFAVNWHQALWHIICDGAQPSPQTRSQQ